MNRHDSEPLKAYRPPASLNIARTQNTSKALRLLLAQRRLYSRAKRWAFLRTIGISVIAIAAPILTAAYPKSAVVVGAVAAAWIFLARTVFVTVERQYSAKGAEVQEQFDLLVFSMPQLALRSPRVAPEEVSDLVGSQAETDRAVNDEHLLDWYPVDSRLDGAHTVAIAQRANAAYSERLLSANANVWLMVTVLWSCVAVVVGVVLGLGFADFLLGVALPLLPALLDVYEQWRATKRAGRERRAIADGIEKVIRREGGRSLRGKDLLVWQDQLYGLRRKAPQVPNLVYKRARRTNELAMNAAAAELADVARANQEKTQH